MRWDGGPGCTDTYQVHQPAESVLAIKEVENGTEGKGDGEEHGRMTAAGRVGALQEPERVVHNLGQDGRRKHAHLVNKTLQVTLTHLQNTIKTRPVTIVTLPIYRTIYGHYLDHFPDLDTGKLCYVRMNAINILSNGAAFVPSSAPCATVTAQG